MQSKTPKAKRPWSDGAWIGCFCNGFDPVCKSEMLHWTYHGEEQGDHFYSNKDKKNGHKKLDLFLFISPL